MLSIERMLKNSRLLHLYLGWNKIRDKGAIMLFSSLQGNQQ